MLEGVVDEKGLPVVTLLIAGQEWKATIDTGFNGDLELPYALGPHVNPQFLAGGCHIWREDKALRKNTTCRLPIRWQGHSRLGYVCLR